MAKKEKTTKKSQIRVGFDLGKMIPKGIFEGIEKIINLAQEAEKEGGELRREGIIRGRGKNKDVRGAYGFTVRTGIGSDRAPDRKEKEE
jgi:hypothetical protein